MDPRYKKLREAVEIIFMQVALGKGEQRHGDDQPFELQGMCRRGRVHGIGFLTGQIAKKAEEIERIIKLKGPDAAIQEVAGIGGYAAGLIVLLMEMKETYKWGNRPT